MNGNMKSQPNPQFMGAVRDALGPALTDQLSEEIPEVAGKIAAGRQVEAIVVRQVFQGYQADLQQKVVLALEVTYPNEYERHIVKIGTTDEVRKDFDGWTACTRDRQVTSRIFAPVRWIDLNKRGAVLYRDAYSAFGPTQQITSQSGPRSLEDAIKDSVRQANPAPLSALRCIRDLYTDCLLYTSPSPRDATLSRMPSSA